MGYRYAWSVPPGLGNDALRLLEWCKSEMDRIGLAPVLFGHLGSDVSGTAQQTAIAVAKSIMAPGVKNICLAFDDMAHMMLRMVEKLGKDGVPVWVTDGPKDEWLVLKPNDVKGYYEVSHTLEPIIPAEQQMKYMWLADAQARGLVDKNTVREAGMNITNPEETDMKVMIENARQSQAYQQKLQEEWLKYHDEAMLPGGAAKGQAPKPNLPIAPGGPGAQVLPGQNAGMMPGQRVATRVEGMGRG
jgi:hypothetical protein